MESDTKESFYANTSVTGVTSGKVNNRQLIIYDKRAEVLAKHKLGWLTIWNDTRSKAGKPPIDLTDRKSSRVWRIESRIGSKCLRRQWAIRSWFDLNAVVGDAFTEFANKMRYAEPQNEQNRSRWPNHELWDQLRSVYATELDQYRSGVLPDAIRTIHRAEHLRMLDQQIEGLMISRAAAEGVSEERFKGFAKAKINLILRDLGKHPLSIEERLNRSSAKYHFR